MLLVGAGIDDSLVVVVTSGLALGVGASSPLAVGVSAESSSAKSGSVRES